MHTSTNNKMSSIDIAREVFEIELDSINQVLDSLGSEFEQAVEEVLKVKGRVVVTGMGKSGHIGAKIAATLASTGTPSFFVHPAEMGHGDLGMLKTDDLVLALSFSGNTEELRKVLPAIKKRNLPLIAITGGKDSSLASFADIVLHTPISKEACPLDLAPTSSTTVALVMGDALAVALMKRRDFKKEDFAQSHPLGSLGRSFVQVEQIMRKEAIPSVEADADMKAILREINSKKFGFTTVVTPANKVIGTITDGDLRRAQINYGADSFNKKAKDIMCSSPKIISPEALAITAAEIMKEYRISSLVVVDNDSKALGVIDLKDMLAEGFVI
ncbi:MAG: KpsF/GutQ family sugar-phosphate isomerase [Cyanobacteria bacterium]|nr:KpsF/GutQ family sugar-phosphate isomerase [Cyanobacteriota bacterium]MDA1020251.1 KpsF/GutQ family sugar-phosphate isomerase [Cyanobacteriota bacterium]